MTTCFDAQIEQLTVRGAPRVMLFTCARPLLHEMDGRQLTVGTVFLHDGAEHTVTSTHAEPIRCALEVHTDKGASVYFTKYSKNVTVIL